MIKIIMVMTLVVMGVRAKTMTECQETVCKSLCQNIKTIPCTSCVFRCAFPSSFQHSDTSVNEVDQRVICYRNCVVGCGTDNACHERCKKSCGYPPLVNQVDQRVICYRNCDVGCETNNACHERCKKTCGYPPLSNEVDQRIICYRNCDVGCGTDIACHERCKKSCAYPPLLNVHL
ncbi:hypothetical protein YC2023_033198 [Brassica napus]